MFGFEIVAFIALAPFALLALPCRQPAYLSPIVADFDTYKHMKGDVIYDPTYTDTYGEEG